MHMNTPTMALPFHCPKCDDWDCQPASVGLGFDCNSCGAKNVTPYVLVSSWCDVKRDAPEKQ